MANLTEVNKVKRMKYFNGLFLTDEEFNLEQNYHIRMRRLHNRHLHTWGIVWGLDVVAVESKPLEVKVTQGMALNKAKGIETEGNKNEDISQEIVLTEDATLVLVSDDIISGVYIYLDFKKVEIDVLEQRGGTKEIHWLEDAAIGHTTSINNINEDEGQLILAKVENDAGTVGEGSIIYFAKSTSLRTYAGAFGNLMLPIEKETPDETSNNPTIEGKKVSGQDIIRVDSPLTEFTGSVDITDTLTGDEIVDTDQIKDDAVNAAKIADGSVGAGELRDNGVTMNKLADEVTSVISAPIVSLNDVGNPGGNIDLNQTDSIVITPDNATNSITIGEKHSSITTGNPHNVIAEDIGALVSINSLNNQSGNIDLISTDKTISIGSINNQINLTLSPELQDSILNLIDQIKLMQRYLMDKSLKYKLKAYTYVLEKFASETAQKIIELTRTAIENKVYMDPEKYLAISIDLTELESNVQEDIKGKVTKDSLEEYVKSVKALVEAIKKKDITLVAVAQDEVCEMAEWLENIEMIVVVPDVVEIHIDQARKVIIGSGLAVGQVTEKFGDLEPGTVVDQYPKGGTEVSVGSSMDLAVVKESVSVWWKDSLRSYFYYNFRIGTPDPNFDYRADLSWWKDSLGNYFYKDMRIN